MNTFINFWAVIVTVLIIVEPFNCFVQDVLVLIGFFLYFKLIRYRCCSKKIVVYNLY